MVNSNVCESTNKLNARYDVGGCVLGCRRGLWDALRRGRRRRLMILFCFAHGLPPKVR